MPKGSPRSAASRADSRSRPFALCSYPSTSGAGRRDGDAAPAGDRASLFFLRREEHARRYGFEFDDIPSTIIDEHDRLLLHIAGEDNLRLCKKIGLRRLQAIGHLVPLVRRDDDAEMAARRGNARRIDGRRTMRCVVRFDMGDEMVAEEIEVYPLLRATPFLAAKQVAVERTRAGKILHRHRQMKRFDRHWRFSQR